MSPERKFDLGDYVEVKDRIKLFYELYAQGRLVTADVKVSSEPDGTPRVFVQALAYRTPDDPHPAVGWSWMVLPGTTSYTRGSELENTETSAWGRAIAATGILIDRSIASAQEVQNKDGAEKKDDGWVYPKEMGPGADMGLIGTAEVGKTRDSDFELRKSGDDEHFILGFKLKSNGGGFKVLTRDELALQLVDVKDEVVGSRIEVWGRVRDETFTPKGSGRAVTYQVIDAERIKTAAGILPMPYPTEQEWAASDAPPIAPGQEVLPLDDEERALVGGAT
jgi:hypothetical protein